MSSFGGAFNSYESPPTFDNDSGHSADSTDTVNHFPLGHITSSPNLLFQPPQSLSPVPLIVPSPPHTMPIYPPKDTHSSSLILPNDRSTKTSKQNVPLKHIFNDFPASLPDRRPIFTNVACGGFVFEIGFYIKRPEQATKDDNVLMIAIEHKKIKRGTKRKASHSQSDGTSTKKRRLNNSQSQSYSINNDTLRSEDDDDDDNKLSSDHIELQLAIYIAAHEESSSPFRKTHKCTFGSKDDDSINLNQWSTDSDTDSDCVSFSNLCSFKTETFSELSTRYSNLHLHEKEKQHLTFWFELQLQNTQTKDDHHRARYDHSKQKHPRPRFEARKISKFVGLKNEGATCYMNSMLQTLYHIASLRRNVYKIPVGHEEEQKKKKKKAEELKKEKENADAMSVCEEDTDTAMNGVDDMMLSVLSDDEDAEIKPKKKMKPHISLELQRLFYQLQTGAESNHQNEYELNEEILTQELHDDPQDDGNDSDCSLFTLKSDAGFANGTTTSVKENGAKNSKKKATDEEEEEDDDDVNMSQSMKDSVVSDDRYRYNTNRWQSSYDKAVSTSQLIKSFGWSGSDAFVQHDVQEFLRVLMDKIEAKVVGTPAEHIVEKMFTGEYDSYVKCKNVAYESVRNENFQDIQLTIPKSVDKERMNTRYWRRSSDDNNLDRAPDIYDCIRKFIEPETLDGNNQYYANDELKKQDADKGLRFTRFPPVLFLQLCRFEIDHYQHTSKINDPVKFYEDIDLNPFVYVEKKEKEDEECDAQNTFYSHLECCADGYSEFGYQLFSVLVHSGSTYGGHYFAYINPSGSQWYKFDDENVMEVDVEEATVKQFGGNSRQSAYMLVYIQKKYALQILREISEGDIPSGLRRYFSAERQKTKQKRAEEIENSKKCVLQYVSAHELCDVAGKDAYVNVLDCGMRTLLQSSNVYKDTRFKDLMEQWCVEYEVPMEHLLVWNYTERKNKTLRANRQIKLDPNEECKEHQQQQNYTEDVIQRHLIATCAKQKKVESMYDRIGNIMEKKRMFMLLDERRMDCIGKGKKRLLIAFKYFDFLTQKLYFAHWLFVRPEKELTFGDIAQYIEDEWIAKSDDRVWMQQLHCHTQQMQAAQKENKLLFYEEEAVLKNRGTRDEPVCKVTQCEYGNKTVDNDGSQIFWDGDIFVFQLNPYHTYFDDKYENQTDLTEKDIATTTESALSMKMRMVESEYASRGVFWYPVCNDFIEGQLNLVSIEVKVRENTGWKQQWSKALLLQYKNNLNCEEAWKNTDKEIRKKIVKSKHKWRMERRTTFGMIRRKLGAYYAINPHHIEIWLPQHSYSGEKWDYGSKGRGKWNAKLAGCVGSKGRAEWKQLCPLKFEIQTYNVKDFDQMTAYDDYASKNSYSQYGNRKIMHFEKRIKELAMFNFDFQSCGGSSSSSRASNQMTISYCKDWCAKGVIQHVLTEVVQNPIFGYTFFANVLKYIKKYEMEETNDLLILQSLKPHRFLICDDNELKSPNVFHMNTRYTMPDSYSQIKYTDFKVFFLAKNDPLVLSLQQPSNKTTIQQKSKALWVFFRRQSKRQHLIRCVLTKGHSLKDVILTHCVPFLKTPKPSLSVDDATAEDKQEEDAWLDCILETHKFTLKSAAANGVAAPLKKEHIENEKIFDQLDATTLCLHVWMPKNKSKYTTYHDRPLTICD